MHARSDRPISRLISWVRPDEPAFDRFAVGASVGGRRQHRVLRGQPPQARPLAPARYPLGDAGGAHDLGVTEFDQHRTGRVLGETAGDDYGAKLVVEAAVFSFGHPATLANA